MRDHTRIVPGGRPEYEAGWWYERDRTACCIRYRTGELVQFDDPIHGDPAGSDAAQGERASDRVPEGPAAHEFDGLSTVWYKHRVCSSRRSIETTVHGDSPDGTLQPRGHYVGRSDCSRRYMVVIARSMVVLRYVLEYKNIPRVSEASVRDALLLPDELVNVVPIFSETKQSGHCLVVSSDHAA